MKTKTSNFLNSIIAFIFIFSSTTAILMIDVNNITKVNIHNLIFVISSIIALLSRKRAIAEMQRWMDEIHKTKKLKTEKSQCY